MASRHEIGFVAQGHLTAQGLYPKGSHSSPSDIRPIEGCKTYFYRECVWTGLPTGKSANTITTVTPSPTRPPAGHILAQGRRGSQEEGEAHQGGHRLHHYTPHQSFYLNKDVKPDGLDVVVKKVNSCT
jgi:hypothetical protein